MEKSGIMKFDKNSNYTFIFFLTLFVFASACAGKKEKKKQQTQPAVYELAKVDGEYLFDGNSLKRMGGHSVWSTGRG